MSIYASPMQQKMMKGMLKSGMSGEPHLDSFGVIW